MLPELVIFDCDGVLIDSELIACRAIVACLAEIGIAMSVEEIIDRYVGGTTAAMLADIAQRHDRRLPGEFAAGLRDRVAADFASDLTPMPGVADVLRVLPCRRCVASSSTPQRLRHSLALTGLLHHFEPHIFSATQVPNGKPAPDLFLFAAASMGAAPPDCLVIEDSLAGVQAAIAAGMRVIGFTGGAHCRPDHADRLRQAGAATVTDTMDAVPALIAQATRLARC